MTFQLLDDVTIAIVRLQQKYSKFVLIAVRFFRFFVSNQDALLELARLRPVQQTERIELLDVTSQ